MAQTPIILNGQRIGRLRASILLFKESFRFFWSDKEMLWVPILAGILQIFLLGVAIVAIFIPAGIFLETAEETATLTPVEYLGIFILYVIGAFTLALSQATITHIVYTRVHGGDATLWNGIRVAGSHAGSLFVWACITSTVGIVLRAIAERSEFLMRIVVAIVGVAWSVLTYFVVTAIVIDKKPAFDAIRHSGDVFKRTWGETLVSNISLGLAFFLFLCVLIVSLIGFVFMMGGSEIAFLISGGVFIVVIIFVSLLSSVLESVLRTLLYVYASEQVVPQNFNRELLEGMLVRKQVTAPETANQHGV